MLSQVKDSELLDYFPTSVLKTLNRGKEFQKAIEQKEREIPAKNPWDTSNVIPGMQVQIKPNKKIGVVTDYHATELGQLNGGVEVKIDGIKEYYYTNQLLKAI